MHNLEIHNYFGEALVAPDVSYCYNSSIELLEITSGDLNYFLKETNFNLTLLFDDCENNNLDFTKTLNFIFNKWYEEIATEKQKSYIFYKFLFDLEFQFDIFNKELFKFYNDGYFDKRMSYKKLLNNIFPKKNNDLINHSSVSSLIEEETYFLSFDKEIRNKNKIKKLFSFYELVLNKIENYSKNVFHTLDTLMKEEYLLNFNKNRNILNNLRVEEAINSIEIKPIKIIKNKKVLKEAKKMLIKSVDTLSSFIGKDKTKAFIEGDSFYINGKLFNYKVYKKKNSLLQQTNETFNINIPYNLELYDLNNEYLASLCITFQGCPILDQVLSVYLMIQSNQEEDILKNSNFFRVSTLFKEKYSHLNTNNQSSFFGSFEVEEENENRTLEYKFQNNLKFKNYLNRIFYKKTLPNEIFQTVFQRGICWDEAVDYYAFEFSNPSLDCFVKAHKLKENYVIF